LQTLESIVTAPSESPARIMTPVETTLQRASENSFHACSPFEVARWCLLHSSCLGSKNWVVPSGFEPDYIIMQVLSSNTPCSVTRSYLYLLSESPASTSLSYLDWDIVFSDVRDPNSQPALHAVLFIPFWKDLSIWLGHSTRWSRMNMPLRFPKDSVDLSSADRRIQFSCLCSWQCPPRCALHGTSQLYPVSHE
jgi:hypothetical protein